jgi:hypothetical protein
VAHDLAHLFERSPQPEQERRSRVPELVEGALDMPSPPGISFAYGYAPRAHAPRAHFT